MVLNIYVLVLIIQCRMDKLESLLICLGTIEENLNTFLLNYRSTANPNTPENQSPGEVIFGRKMRITLDILKPSERNINLIIDIEQKVCQQFNMKHGAKLRIFGEQDNVYARVYKGNN